MSEAGDGDTLARRRGEEATVVSHRRQRGGGGLASEGTEASRTEDETAIRPRLRTPARVPDRPAVPPGPARRVASNGRPEDTVYRPRPADPVIVPRTHG